MKKITLLFGSLAMLVAGMQMSSCKKEVVEVLASFTYEVDASDFRTVHFTSTAQNYSKLSWDFGDNTPVSEETNPVHTYPAVGEFTVTLTATHADGGDTDVYQEKITISDPDADLTKLVGDVSKTWKLLRVVGGGRYPLEVGPIARDQIWWAMGLNNDEIALRPCIMNDEYTFSRDGGYAYNSNGDFWAEGGVFSPANICQSTTPANLQGPNGIDLSAFGDGSHTFVMTNGSNPTLELVGLGAFVGLPKIGTDMEVSVPQPSVKYDIIKLHDGAVDTLILESAWKFGNNTSGQDDAYWRMVLVHYDNPADEPVLPDPKPKASFSAVVNDKTVEFTNTSQYADSYSWDFGDGMSSAEVNPTHTYATAGIYKVVLTATNAAGTATAEQEFTITAGAMTEADLIGGAWKVRAEANSIFVGPALGSNAWWSVPANFLDGSTSGTDDWSCITNDEFIFNADGSYQYKTNGDARNDGYMGSPNGCWSDAQVAASGNGAAFGSNTHSFVFTPETPSTRPIITLTNGPTGAAFIGFYKGYYGGENSDGANAPNGGNATNRYEVMSYVNSGGVETLTISVDYSAAKDGSSAWTVVLVR